MMRLAVRWWPTAAVLFVAVLVMAGCGGGQGLSPDPILASQQVWVGGCKVADSNIQTAKRLGMAGQLSESALDALDEVVDLYDAVCTVDPPDPGAPIASIVVRTLAFKVCPSMAPSNINDWVLTTIEAALCASEGALRLEARL